MADEKPRLTAREPDVLRLIASGHTYAEAAVRLAARLGILDLGAAGG